MTLEKSLSELGDRYVEIEQPFEPSGIGKPFFGLYELYQVKKSEKCRTLSIWYLS